jgi:hypothetical protein
MLYVMYDVIYIYIYIYAICLPLSVASTHLRGERARLARAAKQIEVVTTMRLYYMYICKNVCVYVCMCIYMCICIDSTRIKT